MVWYPYVYIWFMTFYGLIEYYFVSSYSFCTGLDKITITRKLMLTKTLIDAIIMASTDCKP